MEYKPSVTISVGVHATDDERGAFFRVEKLRPGCTTLQLIRRPGDCSGDLTLYLRDSQLAQLRDELDRYFTAQRVAS